MRAGQILSQGEAITHSEQESPMATAVVSTPSVTSRNLPSPFPVSRVVAAVVLVS